MKLDNLEKNDQRNKTSLGFMHDSINIDLIGKYRDNNNEVYEKQKFDYTARMKMINDNALNEVLTRKMSKSKGPIYYSKPLGAAHEFDEYLPRLPTICKPEVKNSKYLKMYLSKGEKGANCESVFNVADNFTFDPNAKEKKKKDNYYTCHRPVEAVCSLQDLG